MQMGYQGKEYIQSPNYPENYPTGIESTWVIKVRNTSNRLTILETTQQGKNVDGLSR